MIEYFEAGLTGASIDALNTDYLEADEEENPDEYITTVSKAINQMEIDIKGEQNTKSYKETMNIDIENINTIEKRHKPYTK